MRFPHLLVVAVLACALVVAEAGPSIADIIASGERDFKNRLEGAKKRGLVSGGQSREAATPLADPHCGHDHVEQRYLKKAKSTMLARQAEAMAHPNRPQKKREVQAGFEPIRFVLDMSRVNSDSGQCISVGQSVNLGADGQYTCTALDTMNSTYRSLVIDNIIPTAVNVMQSLLLVQREGATTHFSRNLYDLGYNTCGDAEVPIPTSFLEGNTGLAGDFWITVTARPFSTNGVIATCTPCMFEEDGDWFGRTVAANVNLAPEYLRGLVVGNYDYNKYIRVLLHEMTHGLGLNSLAFATNVEYYRGFSSFISVGTERGDEVVRFHGAGVTSFARAHFNCPTLEGYEIENNGGSGTAGGHWKGRIGADEYMTGVVRYELRISNLTLAFLQDLGFYQINFDQAEVMLWGKDKGCDFATQKCNTGGTWNDPGYYCTTNNAEGCTFDRMSRGVCRVLTGQTIPSMYRYFPSDSTKGGTAETMDYCPPYSNTQCGDVKENSGYPDVYYGPDAACFAIDISTETGENFDCMKYRCTGDTLEVFVVDRWATCADGNDVTDSSGTYFTVTCPAASEKFCSSRSSKVAITGRAPSSASSLISSPLAILLALSALVLLSL